MLNYKAISRNREKIGMSQQTFSKLTGITIPNISRLEHGKQMNPTLRTLEAIAKALEIPVSKLIDESRATL